jgi:hypothetical protein
MSHVADGILHAYLDGALDALSDAGELPDGATSGDVVSHLSMCADCRARLEAERAIREGAGVVLHDAALARVEVPPFASIPRARRPRRAHWLQLSWAASVLLAVGAGWWGSEVWRATSLATVTSERAASRTQSSPRQAPRSAMEAADAREAVGAESVSEDVSDGDIVTAPVGVAPRLYGRADTAGAAMAPTLDLAAAPRPAADASTAESRAAAARGGDPRIAGSRVAESGIAESRPGDARVADSPAPAPSRQPIGIAVSDSVAGAVPWPTDLALRGFVEPEQNTRLRAAAPPRVALPSSARVTNPADSQLTEPRLADAAAQKQLPGSTSALVMVDSIIARERSGRIHFAVASPSDLRTIADQLFVIADASTPWIELAREIGQTMVRVRQTLPSGERVELMSWRQHAVALDAIAVTGEVARDERGAAAQRSARREAAEPQSYSAVTWNVISAPGLRTLSDGRRELVLRRSSAPVWMAIRADLSAEDLRALRARLRQPAVPPR